MHVHVWLVGFLLMDDQLSDPNARDGELFDDFEPGERPYLPEWLRRQLLAGIAEGKANRAERDAILTEQAKRQAEREAEERANRRVAAAVAAERRGVE